MITKAEKLSEKVNKEEVKEFWIGSKAPAVRAYELPEQNKLKPLIPYKPIMKKTTSYNPPVGTVIPPKQYQS